MNVLLIAIVCLVGLLVPSIVAASEAACDDPRVLRFALIPKTNAQKQQQEFRPLQVELEKALQRRVEITTAPSYGAVIEGLLNDSIDLAELGPASYAMLLDRNYRGHYEVHANENGFIKHAPMFRTLHKLGLDVEGMVNAVNTTLQIAEKKDGKAVSI